MAGRAALRAVSGKVLEGRGRRDLPGLRQPCSDDVAIGAREALALAVRSMAKTETKSTRIRGSSCVAADAVTRAAG